MRVVEDHPRNNKLDRIPKEKILLYNVLKVKKSITFLIYNFVTKNLLYYIDNEEYSIKIHNK